MSNHITMLNEKLPVLKWLLYMEPMALEIQFVKGYQFLESNSFEQKFLDKDTFGKYIFALKENTGTEPMELTIEFETKQEFHIYTLWKL